MKDLFISYAHEDMERVRSMVALFEANHLSVWWDRSIPAGKSFRDLIQGAIQDARCVVVVWSRHSIASKWVQEEADEGMQREILVPVLFDDVRPPIGFRSIQAADLSHWHGDDEDSALPRLLGDISNVLKAAAAGNAAGETVVDASPPAGASQARQQNAPSGAGWLQRVGPKRAFLVAAVGVVVALAFLANIPDSGSPPTQPRVAPDVSPNGPPAGQNGTAANSVQLVMAEPPTADYFVLPSIGQKPDSNLRLNKVSEAPNQIVDDADWWVGNSLERLTFEVPNSFRQRVGNLPATVPPVLNGLPVVKVIKGNPLFAIYGADSSSGRVLLAIDPNSGKQLFGFDFSLYEWPQSFDRKDQEFVQMATTWAHLDGDVLYVAHKHSTYAKSSHGLNAYITAIHVPANRILWRSQPLVSNAANFVVKEDAIVTGYGFSSEKDYLYVLNKADGRVVQQTQIKSGPSDLVVKDGRLYVRTYNVDYVFQFGGAG